jgi:dTDP-4-amino-4,6-dideoxygalactose transaminase
MSSDSNKKTPPTSNIFLSPPHMSGFEKVFIDQAFDTNWIAPIGANVDGFEQDLCDYVGVKHVVGLSSGTAAIHLALLLAGVEPGDEVICQSMTFAASSNPILYTGASPVFIDSELLTWNMDPNLLSETLNIRKKQGKEIKAVIAVHLYGMPAQMDLINYICAEHGVPVIEDAAEALGSKLHGSPCGSLSKFGILSFNGNKIITTSGGGALITDSESCAHKARFLATQARDEAVHYQHSELGYNYRMSNVLAGIGRGQMMVLNERVTARRSIYQYYRSMLVDLPGVEFLPEPDGYYSNRWLTTLLIDREASGGITPDVIRKKLDAVRIESRPLWKPMHKQPLYRDSPYFGGVVAEKLFLNGLCLPSGSTMSLTDQDRVIETIRSCW